MTDLSAHPITRRWPATMPDRLQLYSLPTPNGVKVSAALEEMEIPYEAHLVDIGAGDQMTEAFLSLAPNNKIPAILDPNGPDGTPVGLFESGAILIYLAEKSGKLLPQAQRSEILQWLMWQMGGLGPMLGQLGYFHKFAGREIEDPRPKERYVNEVARLLKVLDRALEGKDWVAGPYSIADLAIGPWLNGLVNFYEAAEMTGWAEGRNLQPYLDRFLARPAVQIGLKTPARA